MGKSNGFGINFDLYTIDDSRFYDEFYHVQITITPEKTNFIADDAGKRKLFTICSIFIAPGAAQYYKKLTY